MAALSPSVVRQHDFGERLKTMDTENPRVPLVGHIITDEEVGALQVRWKSGHVSTPRTACLVCVSPHLTAEVKSGLARLERSNDTAPCSDYRRSWTSFVWYVIVVRLAPI